MTELARLMIKSDGMTSIKWRDVETLNTEVKGDLLDKTSMLVRFV